MMRTKILFSDLDGTLLDDKKNVSDEDLGSINGMIEKGHRFVIATGRPLYSAKVVAKELGLYRDGIFLSASNGGVIYDCSSEKIISASSLDTDTVALLFKSALSEGLSIHTYTDDNVVSVRETEEIRIYTKTIKMPFRLLEHIPEDLPGPPPKLIVVSKGNAVRKLCDLLGIPTEDSIAVGDEANDIPMLEAAGIGAVMKNGTDEAKSYADYVTKRSNNESGVSEIICKYVL